MDEPWPPNPDSPELPGSLPQDGSVGSIGRRMAKLALWSPFASFFVMVVLGAEFGEREDVGQMGMVIIWAFSSLCFLGGLVLGNKALGRIKIEGPEGIKWRALTGMALNGLLLCVSVILICFGTYVARSIASQKAKESTDAQQYATAMSNVNMGFGSQLKKLQSQYQSSWAALTNPFVLDMSHVEGREELKVRVQKTAQVVAACNAFLDFSENSTEVYRRVLQKEQLSPRGRERLLKDFVKSISAKNPQIIAMRQADLRRAQAMLKALTFLDSTWGEWHYEVGTKKILFNHTAEAEEYNSILKNCTDTEAEALRMKEGIK